MMVAALPWQGVRHGNDCTVAQRVDVIVNFFLSDVFGDLAAPNKIDRHEVAVSEDVMSRYWKNRAPDIQLKPIDTVGHETKFVEETNCMTLAAAYV